MGELILCKNRLAAEPFFLEGEELHLYSIEEVCHYILHHLYTADRDLMSYEFVDWIARHCNEPELAERLSRMMGTRESGYGFLMSILLSANGYCTREELKEADQTLKDLLNKSPMERAKTMADADLREGRYGKAIASYRRLLRSRDLAKEPAELAGNIRHNLGAAYAGMFLFHEAMRCFEEAYKENRARESEEAYELAKRLAEGTEALTTPADGKASAVLAKAMEAKRLRDEEGFFDRLSEYADRLKEEYRSLSLR